MNNSARGYTADALFALADVLHHLADQMEGMAHDLSEQIWMADGQLALPGILPLDDETRVCLNALIARAVCSACPKNDASR